MLCNDCEQRLAALEKAGIEMLRAARKATSNPRDGVLIEALDYTRLKRFLTSVVWRAAVSTLPEFHQIILPATYADELRKSLLTERALAPNQLACRLEILFDATSALRGGFSADNLGELIPLTTRKAALRESVISFRSRWLFRRVLRPGCASQGMAAAGNAEDEGRLYIPPRDIFDVPELEQLLVAGFSKHAEGLASESIKRRER